MLRFATGVDLIKMAVKSAVGEENDQLEMPVYNGFWAEIILHSDRDGIFDEVKINNEIFEDNIVEIDLWVKKGDKVNAFRGANDAIGTLVLRFENEEDLEKSITNLSSWLKIIVK